MVGVMDVECPGDGAAASANRCDQNYKTIKYFCSHFLRNMCFVIDSSIRPGPRSLKIVLVKFCS